jgi:hypothetical protein
MFEPTLCDDKQRLIAYLYGEADAADAQTMSAHLETCEACAREAASMRRVRGHLASWTPPDLELGFQIVARQAPRRRPFWQMPAWGLAAAASIALVATLALARLEVRVDRDSVIVRSGWFGAGEAPQVQTAGAPVAADPEWRRDLARVEERLRHELAAPASVRETAPSAPPDNDVLRRVRALIADSEKRQQEELALRLAQVMQDFDRQRQVDLIRIQQGFGRLEGLTGAEAARQREALNYLMRVSQRPQ